MKTRLNKYLSERGVCSRRQADALITAKKVKVNGKVATLGLGVDDNDLILVDGKAIENKRPEKVYIAFHKPVGIMTSVDSKARDTVKSFLKLENHIFPVGRLDVASSGLLLLTNDGELAERITHPRYDHEKEYVVTVDRPLQRSDLKIMEEGIIILGSKTKPSRVKRIGPKRFAIILTEGRNRQIRRMCEELGYGVTALKRTRVMNILLGDLTSGKTRPLTVREVRDLKKKLGLSK